MPVHTYQMSFHLFGTGLSHFHLLFQGVCAIIYHATCYPDIISPDDHAHLQMDDHRTKGSSTVDPFTLTLLTV